MTFLEILKDALPVISTAISVASFTVAVQTRRMGQTTAFETKRSMTSLQVAQNETDSASILLKAGLRIDDLNQRRGYKPSLDDEIAEALSSLAVIETLVNAYEKKGYSSAEIEKLEYRKSNKEIDAILLFEQRMAAKFRNEGWKELLERADALIKKLNKPDTSSTG
jgi:hypothetical protein